MKPAAMPKSLRPIPSLLAIVLLAGGLALGHDAAAEKVYKWTDENGVTHYTDSPPEGREFESREIEREPPPAVDPEPADGFAEDGEAEADGEARQGVSANCRRVRANLNALQASQLISMDLDGDGKQETLTAEQRQAQIELARQQVIAFCPPEAEDGDEE